MGAKSVTKKLIRDLTTGEWIDEADLYKLIPIAEPKSLPETYVHSVAPPPDGAYELCDRQNDTLKYVFGVPSQAAPLPVQRRDWRPAIVFAFPVLAVLVLAYWPVISRQIITVFHR